MWIKTNYDSSPIQRVIERYELLGSRLAILNTMGEDEAIVHRAFPTLRIITQSARTNIAALRNARQAVDERRGSAANVRDELRVMSETVEMYLDHLDKLDAGKPDADKAFVARRGISGII